MAELGTDKPIVKDGAVAGGEQKMRDATPTELIAALDGATIPAATPATADKGLFQDAGSSDEVKQATWAAILELATARLIVTAKYATDQLLTVAECKGATIYVTGTATITLPAVADGMSVSIHTIGAVAVSVDPDDADLIYLDGVALDDGDKITNTSTAGDIAVLTYFDATGWHAATNSWTDGGA